MISRTKAPAQVGEVAEFLQAHDSPPNLQTGGSPLMPDTKRGQGAFLNNPHAYNLCSFSANVKREISPGNRMSGKAIAVALGTAGLHGTTASSSIKVSLAPFNISFSFTVSMSGHFLRLAFAHSVECSILRIRTHRLRMRMIIIITFVAASAPITHANRRRSIWKKIGPVHHIERGHKMITHRLPSALISSLNCSFSERVKCLWISYSSSEQKSRLIEIRALRHMTMQDENRTSASENQSCPV
jgi:hypothetical protein